MFCFHITRKNYEHVLFVSPTALCWDSKQIILSNHEFPKLTLNSPFQQKPAKSGAFKVSCTQVVKTLWSVCSDRGEEEGRRSWLFLSRLHPRGNPARSIPPWRPDTRGTRRLKILTCLCTITSPWHVRRRGPAGSDHGGLQLTQTQRPPFTKRARRMLQVRFIFPTQPTERGRPPLPTTVLT